MISIWSCFSFRIDALWALFSMKKFFFCSLCIGLLFGTGCGDGAPVEVAADIDVPALLEELKSSDKDVRVGACISLSEGLHKAAPALDALIEVVKNDKDARVREMAAYAIYQMGEEEGKPAMPMVKERFEKERSSGVRSVLFNLWNQLEPETSPGATQKAP